MKRNAAVTVWWPLFLCALAWKGQPLIWYLIKTIYNLIGTGDSFRGGMCQGTNGGSSSYIISFLYVHLLYLWDSISNGESLV